VELKSRDSHVTVLATKENQPTLRMPTKFGGKPSDTLPFVPPQHNAAFSVSKQLSEIQFLRRLGPSARVSAQTVNRWLHLLGYKRDRVRKHCCNDKHEDKSNVPHRQEFVQRHFWPERRCHRWIQATKEESARLLEADEVHKDFGCCCTTDGMEMVEHHTDDSCPISAKALKEFPKFGGNLSVRFPIGEKPLVMFGQDECIFKQFTVHSSCWVSETAGRPLMPKDDGQGVMTSAFQSREWGFGFCLIAEEDYLRINAKRDGKMHQDAEAAEAVAGKKPQKQPSNPFFIEFECGANDEGHWTYDHMVLQKEDCVDALKVLHPEFQCIFCSTILVATTARKKTD
jgi:hypothetical protein